MRSVGSNVASARPVVVIAVLLVGACGGGGGSEGQPAVPPPAPQPPSPPLPTNQKPTADAAASPVAVGFSKVVLDASLSADVDGQVVRYLWEQVSGPPVVIQNADASEAHFVAPSADAAQTIGLRLTVWDDKTASSSDELTVQIEPAVASELAVKFLSFDFLRSIGRRAHTDAVISSGMPLAGDIIQGEATIGGQIETVRFDFVTPAGISIDSPDLRARDDPSIPPYRYGGSVKVPSQPFQVEATGRTRDGQSFNVRYPQVFEPQTIALSFRPRGITISPGDTAIATCILENSGPAGTFRLTFDDPAGVLSSLEERTVSIETGQRLEIPLAIRVPDAAPPHSTATVAATVRADNGGSGQNSSTFKIRLVGTP